MDCSGMFYGLFRNVLWIVLECSMDCSRMFSFSRLFHYSGLFHLFCGSYNIPFFRNILSVRSTLLWFPSGILWFLFVSLDLPTPLWSDVLSCLMTSGLSMPPYRLMYFLICWYHIIASWYAIISYKFLIWRNKGYGLWGHCGSKGDTFILVKASLVTFLIEFLRETGFQWGYKGLSRFAASHCLVDEFELMSQNPTHDTTFITMFQQAVSISSSLYYSA